MIKLEVFKRLYPNATSPEEWVDAMNNVFPKYEINTPLRVALFLAQCGYESGGWRRFSENLNYSEKGLLAIFSKYFNSETAKIYARKPELIANIVYANRMGNGNVESGDGWKYRGRGPIQLTGKSNYKRFDSIYKESTISNPDLVFTNKTISLKSAIFFWNTRNLNTFADRVDIIGSTRVINGGFNGLSGRTEAFNKAISLILLDTGFELIRTGSRGDTVKVIQYKLNLKTDGIFGKNTDKAVRQFQESKSLVIDGIIGEVTFKALFGG